ncbi:hypothetical protein LSCM1_04130 [Leishmania martiniquensis]|uniref:BRCT domain-containing protein n=1 Tax=Leishmania martiniquensis TaxID=1580590 RepID=A0A836HGI3_9TRYP|nr:hypothetical protein LSCM1_04130 [Leishmania martiniquensis]
MAGRQQPLPFLTMAIDAEPSSLAARQNRPLDLSGLQPRSCGVHDRCGKSRNAEEDAQTTCEPHEPFQHREEARAGGMPLPSTTTRTGSVCLVSFTGFRDEDEWREDGNGGDGAPHQPSLHGAGSHAAPCARSLSAYEKMAAALPGVQVESKLTSSTTVLVARRGLTLKRLLAARQGIPVVLPRWVEMGCPTLSVGGGACGATAAASALPYDFFAVPWLHGYVFSTTGLLPSEKTAIESVCAAHGAVLDPCLTYKCDVLLTSTECVQALQRLLSADEVGDAARRGRHQHQCRAEVQRTDTGRIECFGAEMAAPSHGRSVSHAAWLTDKLRFALELDVPVVDYVKLFAMLRLDRLPPATWIPGKGRSLPKPGSKMHHRSDDDAEGHNRQYADALKGSDFDSIVDVCRVGAPTGGSPEWARILSVFMNVGEARLTGRSGLQRGGSVAEGGRIGTRSSTPPDNIALRDCSLQSSSSSFTDSASTVSDPDVWEDLLSCALAPPLGDQRLRRAGACPGVCSTVGATTAALPPPSQFLFDRQAMNTAEVEDLADAEQEVSTLHVSLPDYYSATAQPALAPHAPLQWDYAREEMSEATEDADEGIAAVDPSPRLSTNALLHGEPASKRQSIRTDTPSARAQRDEPVYAKLRQTTFACDAAPRGPGGLLPPPHPAAPPDYPATALSPTRGGRGALLAETQVLVESCVGADALELALAQRHDACEPGALRASATRHALPLLAMHPPYLTICVLGCTELELRKTVQWSAQCRMLRSPVPTPTTDLVLLGSRVLTKKRRTVRTAFDSEDKNQQQQQRPSCHLGALPDGGSGETRDRPDQPGRDGVVAIRYWEMDAVVARTLADVCGIPLSRVLPLKWLQDAASDVQRTCEAAKLQTEPKAVHRSAAHTLSEDGGEDSTCNPWAAADTPLDELGGPLKSDLAAAGTAAAAAAAGSETNAAPSQQRQPFHPLPPFSPDQLPDVSDPKYYIRVRWGSAASWAGSATPAAVQRPRDTSAEGAFVEVRAPRSTKHRGMQESAQRVMGDSARQLASVCAPSLTGKETNNADSAPAVEGASLKTTTSLPVAAGTEADGSRAHVHVQPCKGSSNMEDEQQSYVEALATAERRFKQLVTLFRVPGDDNDTRGSVGAAEQDYQGRSRALEACYFCCVEGEYARVDWAVIRGLIRYSGGRAEKRTADDWQALLQQQQQQPSVSANTAIGDAQIAHQEQNLARALRRSVEYVKLHQKFLRVMRSVEGTGESSYQTRAGVDSGGADPAGTRADADEESAAELARLTAKMQRVSHLCQQAPALYLFPHSFQRATADERGLSVAPDAGMRCKKALPGRAGVGAVSAYKHSHPLQRLPAVTMDYVLACIAVGRCLDPHSCFLFDTSIPSSPDMRLFHHHQRGGGSASSQNIKARPTGPRHGHGATGSIEAEGSGGETEKRPRANTVSAGHGCVGRGAAPLCRPALSNWVLERRYSKTDSVGVCISVLWRLPTSAPAEGEQCWSRVDTLPSPRTAAAAERCLTPDASVVPLLRVLLLGLRNAAEALGGHVMDTFSPSAVTHVVSVDVGGIVSGTLRDAFASDAEEKMGAEAGSSDGSSPFPYWPAEGIECIVRCAARDEVSLVSLDWLAACVEYGVFVEEAAYAPPPELRALVEAEAQRAAVVSAQAARKKQQQRRQPRQPRSRCDFSERGGRLAAPPDVHPAPPSSLASHEARLAFPLEEHRKRVDTWTCASSEAATPHKRWPLQVLGDGAPPGRDNKGREQREECRTPVRRCAPTASATLCDSCVEPCTPPIRKESAPERAAQRLQEPLPPQPLSSPVPPPPQPLSSPNLESSWTDFRARSAGTPPAGYRNRRLQHRSRSLLSASQHNTRSLREQQDADAYVEHLGDLFNFVSPGSTPLPSSARRLREHSTATLAATDAVTPQRLDSPLTECNRSQSRPPMVSTAYGGPQPHSGIALGRDACSTPSSQRTQVLAASPTEEIPKMTAAGTKDSTLGPSDLLSTPRRRTLRGAAAITAALTSSASKITTLSSPDKQRRRIEEVDVAVNDSVADSRTRVPLPGTVHALCAVGSAAPDAGAMPPPLLALPNLLGGSTDLSGDGTANEKAVGLSITHASSEEVDGYEQHLLGGRCTTSLLASQTQDALGEGGERRARGTLNGTAQQNRASKRSRVGGGPQDGSHVRSKLALGAPQLSSPAAVAWTHDVIPDPREEQWQPQDIAVVECVDAEAIDGDVLEPASFVAATAEEYGPTPAAMAETAVGESECKGAAAVLPAGEREEVRCGEDTKAVSSAPCATGAAHGPPVLAPPTTAEAATLLKRKSAQPRSESCTAPRQPSPTPYPPPSSPTPAMDEDGRVGSFAKATEEEQRCGMPCARAASNATPPSPWSRHRPLSLSRRPSRSPPPVPALGPAKPTALAIDIVPRTSAVTSSAVECLRLYVLHDLPHRVARVRRCEEALQLLMRRRRGVEPKPYAGGVSPVKGDGHGSDAHASSGSPSLTTNPQPAPPLSFVARCEDANVLVAHEVNLRESVLLAVVAGCWVVQPGFLECAAAVLDGACWDDGSNSTDLTGGRWPTLQLQSPRHSTFGPAAATASAVCLMRLREALPIYEWTAEALPRALESECPPPNDTVPPVQRALVQQCRLQRQVRERAAVGSITGGSAGQRPATGQLHRRAFEGGSFLLLSRPFLETGAPVGETEGVKADVEDAGSCRTSSRVRAIARILESGGGHVCYCVQVGCTVAYVEKVDEVSETVATSARAALVEEPPLQCCVRASLPCGQWRQLRRRSLALTLSSPVTDAVLYRDLLWLICHQVRREPLETLFVLLDASLLDMDTDNDHGATTVHVTAGSHTAVHRCVSSEARRNGKETGSAEVLTTLASFEDDCASKKRRTEAAERPNGTQPYPTSASAVAAAAAGDVASYRTCTVAAWLSSWLLLSPDDGSRSVAVDEALPCAPCYAPVAAEAMRAHFCACCTAVRTPSTAPGPSNVTGVPFPVPSVEEVCQACAGVDGRAEAESTASAGRGRVRRIEFRSAGWVGACVAAGGAAAMATSTDAWMRAGEAHTLLGVLFLECMPL